MRKETKITEHQVFLVFWSVVIAASILLLVIGTFVS